MNLINITAALKTVYLKRSDHSGARSPWPTWPKNLLSLFCCKQKPFLRSPMHLERSPHSLVFRFVSGDSGTSRCVLAIVRSSLWLQERHKLSYCFKSDFKQLKLHFEDLVFTELWVRVALTQLQVIDWDQRQSSCLTVEFSVCQGLKSSWFACFIFESMAKHSTLNATVKVLGTYLST